MAEKWLRRADLERLRHNRSIILALYDELAEERTKNKRLILCHAAEIVNLKEESNANESDR